MTYGGIDRGDGRTPEQKAAAANIEVGYPAEPGGSCVFRCRECGETAWMICGDYGIKHKPGCKAGKVLEGL